MGPRRAVVLENDLVLVCDEVYETLVFEVRHRLPDLASRARDRTVVISSIGKTFSLTGWKIGWCVAASPLTEAVRASHQFLNFSVATPLQAGAATGFALPDSYFDGLLEDYLERRDLLVEGLDSVGLRPRANPRAYFVLADVGSLGVTDDRAFCDRMLHELGVAAIPTSPFHHDGRSGPVRFAFCKPRFGDRRRHRPDSGRRRAPPMSRGGHSRPPLGAWNRDSGRRGGVGRGPA